MKLYHLITVVIILWLLLFVFISPSHSDTKGIIKPDTPSSYPITAMDLIIRATNADVMCWVPDKQRKNRADLLCSFIFHGEFTADRLSEVAPPIEKSRVKPPDKGEKVKI